MIRKLILFTFILSLSFLNVFMGSKKGFCNETFTLEKIMTGIEKRYGARGFKADFRQISTIAAIDIKDFASGKIYIKYPGKLRWEYYEPENQIFISDGLKLWIYKPEEKQVIIGDAPFFFGDGKGAGFLSNIKLMRKNFKISIQKVLKNKATLKMLPKNSSVDLALLYVDVSLDTFDIVKVITLNLYRDKTEVTLENVTFDDNIDDSLFDFKIPKGAEIFHIDN